VLLGVPVFMVWSRKSARSESPGELPGGTAENG
jgi:hypothetical protein